MNPEETESTYYEQFISRPYAIYLLVSGLLVLIVLAALFAVRKPTHALTTAKIDATDPLASARRDLVKTTDLATCRNAIQQINLYLTEHSQRKAPALSPEQRAFITEHCLADPSELAELEGGAYTLLDTHHLDQCFLFRDAVQSLEVSGQPLAERAEAAFRWTVRQVRLRDSIRPDSDPVPPESVVRRGWGTAEERALVFLAILRQLGLEGCLIASPTSDREHPLYWACGALGGGKEQGDSTKKEILLFDPRMGIPLPGPNGEGIATLTDLRSHPDILKALTVNPEFPYDVTPEHVAGAEIFLVEPLSALSPRMAALQNDLLGSSVKGRLIEDPKIAFEHFAEAAQSSNVPVRIATRWTGILRRFLPPDDGGSDQRFGFPLRALPGFVSDDAENPKVEMTRRKLYDLELIPWRFLPELIRELPWSSYLGQRPRDFFERSFVAFYSEPRKPRDLVLRGQYDEAVGILVLDRSKYEDDKRRLADSLAELREQLNAWRKRAFEAFGALARAEQKGAVADGEQSLPLPEAKRRVEMVWREGEKPLSILLEGRAAEPLNAEATYLLALAWQEQALRVQARIDRDRRAGRADNAGDVAAARTAWQTTLSWWHTLSADPVAAPLSTIARRWQADAYRAQGDKETARALLEDLTGSLTPLEKTARLYLASRLKP